MNDLQKIQNQALSLPEDQRISLAHKIIESTEPSSNSTLKKWWDQELARRIQLVDSRDTDLVEASEVFRLLDKRLAK